MEDAINICLSFTSSYEGKKATVAQNFKEGVPVVEWSFNNKLIFARLDKLKECLMTIQVILQKKMA